MFFYDTHKEFVKNNRFLVFIGVIKISFAKVSGFEQELGTEYFVEGGNNEYPILSFTPPRERRTLRFERGVQSWNPILSRMKPGVSIPGGITVVILNDNSFPVHTYSCDDVIVTKWEVADFDAKDTDVLIETFEVTCTSMDRTNWQII